MFRLLVAYYLFRGGRQHPRPQSFGQWVRAFLLAALVVTALALIGKYA